MPKIFGIRSTPNSLKELVSIPRSKRGQGSKHIDGLYNSRRRHSQDRQVSARAISEGGPDGVMNFFMKTALGRRRPLACPKQIPLSGRRDRTNTIAREATVGPSADRELGERFKQLNRRFSTSIIPLRVSNIPRGQSIDAGVAPRRVIHPGWRRRAYIFKTRTFLVLSTP